MQAVCRIVHPGLCSTPSEGLDGFAGFKNEHGRCFSDAWDAFELGENEVAKGLDVANPQAKDVVEIARYQQALRNFRLAMYRCQKFSDVIWSLPGETNGHDHADAQAKRGRIDPSAIAGDDADLLQSPYSTTTGRWGQPDALSEVQIGDAPLRLEHAEDAPIYGVKFDVSHYLFPMPLL
jgi:hypothetical protein